MKIHMRFLSQSWWRSSASRSLIHMRPSTHTQAARNKDHRRFFSSSSTNSTPSTSKNGRKTSTIHAASKEEERIPRWLQRMAPPKGGTAPPNKTEAMVIGTVLVLGYFAWFVDPGSWLVKPGSEKGVEKVVVGGDEGKRFKE